MAKLHTKKKGKSGSRKVVSEAKWVEIGKEEIEKTILEHHKSGTAASAIGHILRDQYAVPNVKAVTGKSVLQIIESATGKQDFPENLMNLIRKAVRTRTHLDKNKSDVHNRVKLQSIEAKIRRLGKYYARTGKLPKGWAYNRKEAALMFK